MLQLQQELNYDSAEQRANEMLEQFEQQQAALPLAHARQALNLSRAKAALEKAQEELREKNRELVRLREMAVSHYSWV